MPSLAASVIVRAHNSRVDLAELVPMLRRQTTAAELIVVDSGSVDGSMEIAEGLADEVVRLAPGTYRPGGALNAGAQRASGEIVFALSSHCRPERPDWIERSLEHYEREDVAATNGSPRGPDRAPFHDVFLQDAAHARRHAHWGFSNHASSWRASVWRRHAFDPEVVTAEDRLWAVRVTDDGWRIAFDPLLFVSQAHRYNRGAAQFLRRERRELIVIGANIALSPYPFVSMVADWWSDLPVDSHSAFFHRLVNYRRAAGLAGKYLGHREARRIRR